VTNGEVTLRLHGKDRRIAGGPFDSWNGFGIGLCLDSGAARRTQADLVLDIEDFTAPTPAALADTLAALLALWRDRPHDDLFIGCRAGYGRTGTLVAALASLAGHADPVAWTRARYHPKAVETPAQEQAVAALDAGAIWKSYRERTATTPPPVALYHYPDNASTFPHMLLRELGIPFELRLVDRARNAQRSPEYLRLNPRGLIPVLVDGDLVVTETAAIALHLLDRHSECGLAPAVGTPRRATFYEWMIHLTNTPQVEHLKRAYPDRHTTIANAVADVKATAISRLDTIFDQIEADLGDRPFLLGERFSAVDLFLLMMVLWTGRMPRPAWTLPRLAAHARRVCARPAVRATLEAEGIAPP
jgi:glutathione S-transferase